MNSLPKIIAAGLLASTSFCSAADDSTPATPVKDKPAAPQETTGDASVPPVIEESAAEVRDTADDATITAKIKSKLLADTVAPGLKINVTTNSGIVTLEGDVKSDAERQRAEEIAASTAGVIQVKNLLVSPTG
jgi:osmotically-inducible protein OsmY